MYHRGIGKQKLFAIGMVVLALTVGCSDPDSGQAELKAVSGLGPADGASTTDTTPTLSWDTMPDAAEYEVQLADSKAGVEIFQPQSVTDTSYTPSSVLTNEQTYYWRVRAVDGAGQKGDWSAVYSLAVSIGAVTGLSPADGSTTADSQPMLGWTAVPGAEGYEVRIADSQTGLDSASSVSVTDSSHRPSSALTNLQTHYWQVRAKDSGGQYGPWSAGQSLKVEWGAISGLSPADGSTTADTTPMLGWTAVPESAGYEVRIADSQTGLDSASSVSVTDSSHRPSSALTNLQTHYWQVRAKDSGGQYGPWSAGQSLKVEWGAISGLSPVDGSTTTDTTPMLGWTAVPGAEGYELRIADSQTGLENASPVSVTAASHTPSSVLTNLQTHYWQVRAKDGSGQKGAWGAIHSLAVSIGAVSGLSPADGSTTAETQPMLSWTAVPGAAGYEVRIADSQAGLDSASSASVTDSSHRPSSALTNLQTHYWQVRAGDSGGQYGPWSAGQSLKVEWGTISGQSPIDGGSTTNIMPTLSWNAVPDAAGYEVQLADSEAGVETSQTQSVTDRSYTPLSALAKGQTFYWRVRAVDEAGKKGAWSVVIAVQIAYSIGDTGPAGGIVFYDKGSYSDGWRYLEAAPSDQSTGLQWEGHGTEVASTLTDIGSGKANTEAIVTKLGSGNYAAKLCYDLVLGGYDDWFLPSKDELNELYKQKFIIGGFVTNLYWSSSESSSIAVWLQHFLDGSQFTHYKNYDRYIRAVRTF